MVGSKIQWVWNLSFYLTVFIWEEIQSQNVLESSIKTFYLYRVSKETSFWSAACRIYPCFYANQVPFPGKNLEHHDWCGLGQVGRSINISTIMWGYHEFPEQPCAGVGCFLPNKTLRGWTALFPSSTLFLQLQCQIPGVLHTETLLMAGCFFASDLPAFSAALGSPPPLLPPASFSCFLTDQLKTAWDLGVFRVFCVKDNGICSGYGSCWIQQ